jgi:hypothetical protein
MEPVLHSFAYCLDFLREQVADVPAEDLVAQPNGIMNHPAWVIGHLTFVCQLLGGQSGYPPGCPMSGPDGLVPAALRSPMPVVMKPGKMRWRYSPMLSLDSPQPWSS